MAGRRVEECDLAEAALARALERSGVAVDEQGYCRQLTDNLIEAITPALWAQAHEELSGGKGSELNWKFRAAYSSSALAVNTFVPMTGGVDLPGLGFVAGRPRLEVECSAGAQGFKPTLDVLIEGEELTLMVESKCREYLGAGEADFSVAFPKLAAAHLSDRAARVFGDVSSFDPVDAPQLLKDILAAEKIAREQERRVVLLYTYWEPSNAHAYPIFTRHAEQAQALIAPCSHGQVQMLAVSYTELWDHWEAVGAAHVEQLRARYDVPLCAPTRGGAGS